MPHIRWMKTVPDDLKLHNQWLNCKKRSDGTLPFPSFLPFPSSAAK